MSAHPSTWGIWWVQIGSLPNVLPAKYVSKPEPMAQARRTRANVRPPRYIGETARHHAFLRDTIIVHTKILINMLLKPHVLVRARPAVGGCQRGSTVNAGLLLITRGEAAFLNFGRRCGCFLGPRA
jgi:hypothetical protein